MTDSGCVCSAVITERCHSLAWRANPYGRHLIVIVVLHSNSVHLSFLNTAAAVAATRTLINLSRKWIFHVIEWLFYAFRFYSIPNGRIVLWYCYTIFLVFYFFLLFRTVISINMDNNSKICCSRLDRILFNAIIIIKIHCGSREKMRQQRSSIHIHMVCFLFSF